MWSLDDPRAEENIRTSAIQQTARCPHRAPPLGRRDYRSEDPRGTADSAGAVHGGVLASMADTASGIALHLHFGGRRPITTTDLKINYLRPIMQGKIIARSHLVRVGKTLGVGRVELFDDRERKLAAIAIVTYMILA